MRSLIEIVMLSGHERSLFDFILFAWNHAHTRLTLDILHDSIDSRIAVISIGQEFSKATVACCILSWQSLSLLMHQLALF